MHCVYGASDKFYTQMSQAHDLILFLFLSPHARPLLFSLSLSLHISGAIWFGMGASVKKSRGRCASKIMRVLVVVRDRHDDMDVFRVSSI